MPDEVEKVVKEYQLNEDNELRLEVEGKEDIIIELLKGSAEIFGTPIALHKRYTLPPGFRCAIFTYKGAVIEIVAKTEQNFSAYIAQQTPMIIYLNTHAALESLRDVAEEQLKADPNSSARGPRLLVAGPVDVGKSTLCRILCNYAVREGRTPQYVDLDIGQGSISVPGTIGSLYIEKPADIIENFDRKSAYIFNFGNVTPTANISLYDQLVKQLASAVKRKCKSSLAANVGGYIVNTCGWVRGEGYDMIVKAAEAFEPDVVIVIDHERLYNELQKDLPSFVKILHMPKSGGVETRAHDIRINNRHNAIHRYFYGTKSSPFFPHSFEISYDKTTEEQELLIAKIGAEQLPDSCLPVGMVIEDHRTMVVSVPIGPKLLNHVLALMPPDTTVIDQTLAQKPCLGFLVVTGVDATKKIITVLSPQPYPLSSKVALLSEVTFVDSDAVQT